MRGGDSAVNDRVKGGGSDPRGLENQDRANDTSGVRSPASAAFSAAR